MLVQPDTYVENINFNGHNIILGSLFLTIGDTSYISSTIIDGDSSGTVVTFENEEDSTAVITGFTIQNGVAFWGGGIYCRDNSNPHLTNITVSGNTAHAGGGIFCSYSRPSLVNVTICENTAAEGGGTCYVNSNPSLEDVTISGNNAAIYGGGISCYESNPSFHSVNRCNICLNFAGSAGCDLYASDRSNINVIVDTFTILQPNDYFAYPMDNFTFDILSSKIEQVNHDLYVRPIGSNDNSGSSPDDPLLTISFALIKIIADSANPHSIYLANGIYSPSQTGETFPLNCRSYVSLLGAGEASTILDGEGLSGILLCENDNNFSIENITIQNGSAVYVMILGGICCIRSSPSLVNVTISENNAHYGGGIYCGGNSNPRLTNVTVSGNTARHGGGIYCPISNPSLENVIISGNTADSRGGGTFCSNSSPSLENVTISGNIADSGGGIYCYDSSTPSLLNCILWNDTPQEIYGSSDSVTVTYSDIQGGWTGTGNMDEDPMFVSGPLGDYHLCPFTPSPCIDAGNPDPMYNDPENPLIPGYAMWPVLERSGMIWVCMVVQIRLSGLVLKKMKPFCQALSS